MTALSNRNSDGETAQLERRRALTGILEHAVASLELTATQRDSVEKTYAECGTHLSKALGLAEDLGDIFPQGSMRLGTVIRPLRDITEVFDLDVVFRVAVPCTKNRPEKLRSAVGDHLREKYNGAVKPLAKGWRLDFSQERDYYLDVIPAMDSVSGGNVIAITDAANWRDSNPRDYATWFERHAAVMPLFEGEVGLNERRMMAKSASIEPLPEHTHFKSPLQRITQISKRHRDYYFNKKTNQPSLVTPSIVVTTLLTKAYECLVNTRTYSSGYDLLVSCVEDMPNRLEVEKDAAGTTHFRLPNPSLPSENLVERWKVPAQARAFYAWHKEFVTFLQQLPLAEVPQRRLLSETLGARAVNAAFAKQAESFNGARNHRLLTVVPTVGLSLGAVAPVSAHVIHGR